MDSSQYNYKVGIVIPNWNGEHRISLMLDSILCQDFQDWKVFIIDDKSTDKSVEVIKKYIAKDNRINLFIRDHEPKGAQTCRNIGFNLTTGAEYVCFFDNDDIIAPYCLSQRTYFMDTHPKLDFAVFSMKSFETNPYDENWGFWGGRIKEDEIEAFFDRTLPMVVCTNIYRRINYCKKGLIWDTNLKSMQDSDFNIQAILKGCSFLYANEYLPNTIDYFYYTPRKRKSVSTKINSEDHAESNIYLINKITNSLSKEQKIKYKSNLQRYILSFLFNGCHQSFAQGMLSNPWVKSQIKFWLLIKLLILSGMRQRILLHLFKLHYEEFKRREKKWHLFMRKETTSFINTNKRHPIFGEFYYNCLLNKCII